jgi:hypothetical protein
MASRRLRADRGSLMKRGLSLGVIVAVGVAVAVALRWI